uniref:Nose resistant to fluoxetine protein 6 n=1 Tax=Toxocara canis TaxID=6265 RepID=A0A183U2H2_TOXCA
LHYPLGQLIYWLFVPILIFTILLMFIFYPGQDPSTMAHIYAGLWEMYARPYTKCGPFLLGSLLGYYIFCTNIQLSSLKSKLILSSSIVLAVATVYGILPEYWHPDQGNTLYNVLYTALFRTVFSAAIAFAIAALVLRKERVNVPLIWTVLARLTFNAYLLHMPMIYIFNNVQFLQNATTPYELLAIMPFVATLSFLAAFVFYVFVESPIGRISNVLLKSVF